MRKFYLFLAKVAVKSLIYAKNISY